MLQQILDYIHNYFIKEVYRGNFTISDGSVSVDFLRSGQYFCIRGSVFNDGVHQYPTDNLTDEEFNGEIWAMAVPPALIELSSEISDWVAKYKDVVNSPYSSESFGGYSYNKSQGSTNSGGGTQSGWQSVFATRLNAYRKIS